MGSKIVGADEVTLWLQESGPGTTFDVYGVRDKAAAMTGKSIPGPGITPVYGRDRFGNPVVIKTNREAPGDLPGATLVFHETAQLSVMKKLLNKGCEINAQERIRQCGTLDHPNLWDKIRQWGAGTITGITPGDSPSLTFEGTEVSEEATVMFSHVIEIVKNALTAQSSGVNASIMSVTGIKDEDCNACGNGYVGSDKLLWAGAAAHSYLLTANVLYTRNGGGSWSLTTADPFAAGEAVDFIMADFIDSDTIRIITGTGTTDAAAKAKIAYADVSLGDEGTTVWTTVNIAATALGDVIEAMDWLFFDRLYIASAGDIYVSTDQGESDPGAAAYTGSTTINGFALSPSQSEVYAFGASNLLLRERNKSGSFDTLVGPAGGGSFTALTVAGRRTVMYAGNGQKLYMSVDLGNSAANWTELKDFGTNKVVKSIQCVGGERAGGGDSELLRVVVDDTAGSTGQVWISVDGGATFQQVASLTNVGYNDAYWSDVDDNFGIIVGDVTGAAGVIQKLSPVS